MIDIIITSALLVAGILISIFGGSGMFIVIVVFLIGLGLIIKGGDMFVDASSWIAEKSGVPKFIIGATIVSIATTLPEMIASITGTLEGALGLAVGNAIGSVTANSGLIMAISIMFMPALVKRKDYAFKSILLLVVTGMLAILMINGKLNIYSAIIVIICFGAFIWENIVSTKAAFLNDGEDKNDAEVELEQIEEKEKKLEEEVGEKKPLEVIINIIKFILGAAGIYFGAKYLVASGVEIATALHVSEDVIGLTLVAIGTSLPELVTTITAIAKKQSELSVGNIIGANIIDMSLILPVCAFVSHGGTLVLDSMQTVYLDLPVCFGIIAIMVIPMLINKKFSRWQGIVALSIYIAYLVVISAGLISF